MFTIDTHSSRPIYEQIINSMKEQLVKGLLNPGDQLPPVRQLAGILSINPNTVSRAYQELERQHIIETIRGKGTFICLELNLKPDQERIKVLDDELQNLCIQYYYMGITQDEIIHQIHQIMTALEKGNEDDHCK